MGEARLVGGQWVVTAPPHVLMRMKRVFGRLAKGKTKELHLRDTPEVCRELDWFSQRFPLEFSDRDHLVARSKHHQHVAREVAALMAGSSAPRAFELAVPAREYQKIAAEMWLRRRSLLLADDLGVGKTASAICGLVEPETRPALVVTLTHLPEQWKRELARFAPGLHVHVLKGAKPYPLTIDKPGQGALFDGFPDVIISNYHKLAGWSDVLAGRVRSVVFDEAQELRVGTGRNVSEKYAAAKSIAEQAEYRLGLTATPIYNYGIEFWSVLSVLAPTELGEKEEFRTEWCTSSFDERKAKIKDPRAFGTYLRESGLMLRRTRSDVGRELPAASVVMHHVDADLDELKRVEQSAAELARLILSTSGTGGFAKMKASEELDYRLRQATGIAKAPFVARFVRMLVESGEPVVLFGWHKEVYRIWASSLEDLGVVFYTGAESSTQKASSVAAFTEGKAKVLVVSLRAGAGLDGLQHVCRTGVFGELDWSPGAMEQCGGRLHRDGQKEPVMLYMLVSDSGSDPIIADVLGLKRGQVERVRDPDAPLLEQLTTAPDHVLKLAEAYLEQLARRAA